MKKNFYDKFLLPTLVVVTMVLWASAFVGIRYAVNGYHPGSLALFRYVIASLSMIFIWKRNTKPSLERKQDIPLLILIGLLGIAVYNVTLNHSEMTISAAEASFIISQTPVTNAILAVLFLGEPARKQLWFGLGISVIGVSLIALNNIQEFSMQAGLWFALIATLCSALYTILQKPLLTRISPMRCACYAIWIGTFGLLIYTPELYRDIQTAPLSATLTVIYLGIFPAAIAYAAWSYILSRLSATKTSSTLYLSPLFTALLGWIILSEVPSVLCITGGLIALLGAYIINRRPRT